MDFIYFVDVFAHFRVNQYAIETTLDLITKRFSHRAKLAKDMASAAVLLNAILVVLFSIFIYGPGMYNFFIGDMIGH